MSFGFTETKVEEAPLAWLGELGYAIKAGPETIAFEVPPSQFLFHLDRPAYVEALTRHVRPKL